MSDDIGNKKNDRWERRQQRWEARMEFGGGSNVWTGIFILLIGVGALIKVTNPDLPSWLFSWKTFLIALGIYLGFKHSFKGPAWIILMLLGGAFLLRDMYPALPIRQYIWPAILILIGAVMILRPKHSTWACNDKKQKKNKPSNSGIEEATVIDETHNHKEDYLNSTCIFSGSKKIIITKNFKGGEVVTIFGGTELDFSQADMTKTIALEVTTIFGGTKLIIPSNWEIKSEAVMIFGGIEDKRRMQTITGEPEKTLILKGTVMFGGIEIKSY